MHRDIKPDNFLVDLDGGIVLADFGLSLEAELHRGINGKCGTEDYLAPEQLWGATYNSQVDVWQLACTLIELFGGLQDTWMGTFGPTGSPLSYDRLSLDKIQEMLDLSVLDIMPDDHPATNLILQVGWSLSVVRFFVADTNIDDRDPSRRPSDGRRHQGPRVVQGNRLGRSSLRTTGGA